MVATLVRPRVGAYLPALLLLALAGLAGHRAYEARLAAILGSLERFVAPDTVRLTLASAGHHTIFLEHRSAHQGSLFLTGESLGDLRCTVHGPDGAGVPLRSTWLPLRYDLDRHAGRAVLEFDAPSPGAYEIEATYPAGTAGPRVVLAVGEGLLGDLSPSIVAALAFPAAAGLLGLGWAFVVWRMRERSKKRVFRR